MNVFLILVYTAGLAFASIRGNTTLAGSSIAEGAENAVAFILGIAGSVCLWSGVMEVMERSGITERLAVLLRPILRRLFPKSSENGEVLGAITENISANLLGLGNAATPAGVRAARGMKRLSGPDASDELCTFVVLNTASIQLLPTTIAAVRAAHGAVSAFDIMPAVWISSLISVGTGLGAAAMLKRVWR